MKYILIFIAVVLGLSLLYIHMLDVKKKEKDEDGLQKNTEVDENIAEQVPEDPEPFQDTWTSDIPSQTDSSGDSHQWN